jgi:septal ring factor EnvC (AmiA/AmiB activator)
VRALKRASCALLAIGVALGAETLAAPARQQLEHIEQDIEASRARQRELDERARKLEEEAILLQDRLIEAAKRVRLKEALLEEIEADLDRLQAAEMKKTAALARRRSEIAATLSALVRIGRAPPEAVLFAPQAAIDRLRAAKLLAGFVPAIESEAEALRGELDQLASIRRDLSAERENMETAIAALQTERQTLRELHGQAAQNRRLTLSEREAEAERAARLAETARDLRALLAELEKQPAGKMPPERLALAAPPALPAIGRIVSRFGEVSALGVKHKGIELETRPQAQVVAPAAGRIVFAGPFRGYGLLLIIATREGYHVLLSGCARLDGEVGQTIAAGEPVGQMGDISSGRPILYMEVRRRGEPIDPLPWVAAGERKVSG